MGPHVPRSHACDGVAQRVSGLGRPPIEQNAAGNAGRFFRGASDCVVIKGMQRVVVAEFVRDVDHLIFDAESLQLDVDRRALSDRVEHVAQSRDSVAIPEIDVRQIAPCRSRDHLALDRRVMMDHDLAIVGYMGVQLDGVGAAVEREEESR